VPGQQQAAQQQQQQQVVAPAAVSACSPTMSGACGVGVAGVHA
jgi:hypothetical protein